MNQNAMNSMMLNNTANYQMNHMMFLQMMALNNEKETECVIEQPIEHHKSSILPKPFAICGLILSIVALIAMFSLPFYLTK